MAIPGLYTYSLLPEDKLIVCIEIKSDYDIISRHFAKMPVLLDTEVMSAFETIALHRYMVLHSIETGRPNGNSISS